MSRMSTMLATAVAGKKTKTLMFISYHSLDIVLGTCTYTSFNFHINPFSECYPPLLYTNKTKTKGLAQGKRQSWFWNVGLSDSKGNAFPSWSSYLHHPRWRAAWRTQENGSPEAHRNSPNYAIFIEIYTIEMGQRSLPPAS